VTVAVVGAARVVKVSPDAADVRLGPDEYLAVRLSGPPEAVSRAGDRVRLPFRYARLGEPGLHLVVAIELEEGGLRYAVQGQGSEGAFLIGLQDTVQPEVRRALSPPIRFRLSVDDGTVAPNAVDLTHTNIPFTRVVVRAHTPSDSVAVRIRPEFEDRGIAVGLPVRPPAVSVTPASHRILGFGFESVRIRLTAPVGVLPGAATARVTVDRGSAEPSSIVLGHDGVAIVSLRSRGLGTATVTVTGPSMLGATTIIEFVWPATLLVSVLLGAVCGVGVSVLRARRGARRPTLSERGGQLVVGLAAGAVSALVLGLIANGTTVAIPIRVAEATVLVVAGMGACVAPPGLESVRRRLGMMSATARH
jgi:hypothetical protein